MGKAPGEFDDFRTAIYDELRKYWRSHFVTPEHDHVLQDLVTRYGEPGRYYHNLAHIRDCFRKLYAVSQFITDDRAVDLALFFHDAIYNPTRGDNEERSADLAEQQLRALGEDEARIAVVRDLILDTRHVTSPASSDGRLVVDVDLSILGETPELFDVYERAIRREYAHVPDEAFRAGRARVLRQFLDRPRIFGTDIFRDRYEAAARANLARSLKALQA